MKSHYALWVKNSICISWGIISKTLNIWLAQLFLFYFLLYQFLFVVVVFLFFAFKNVFCFKLYANKPSHMNVNIIWVILKGFLMLPLLQKIFIFTLLTPHYEKRKPSWELVAVDMNCGSLIESNVAFGQFPFFPLNFSVLTCKIEIKMSIPNTWKFCYTNQNR